MELLRYQTRRNINQNAGGALKNAMTMNKWNITSPQNNLAKGKKDSRNSLTNIFNEP